MPKTLISAALAAATVSTGGLATQPVLASEWGLEPAIARSAQPQVEKVQYRRDFRCYPGERIYDCRERARWERRHNRRMIWRDGRYHDNDTGAAIAGGVIGFALGAAIAGSRDDYNYYYAHRHDRAWLARCQATSTTAWGRVLAIGLERFVGNRSGRSSYIVGWKTGPPQGWHGRRRDAVPSRFRRRER